MPDAELDGLLTGLHAVLGGRADWHEEWGAVERWLGAQSSLLSIVDKDGSPRYLAFPSISPADIERYRVHYRRLDPYDTMAAPGVSTGIVAGTDVISTAAYVETEFFRDFVRTLPEPALHFLGGMHVLPGGRQLRLGFQRRPGAAEFAASELARLRVFMPYLVGLMIGWDVVTGLRERLAERGGALDAAGDGIVLLDGDGRVRHMNRAAVRLAARHGLLGRDGGGRPVLRGAMLPDRFGPALRQVAAGGPGRMLIGWGLNGPAIALTLCPASAAPDDAFNGPPAPCRAVLLRLKDLRQRPDAATALRDGFGLTRAEAQVALLLAEGADPAEIAASRQVAVTTVRTQLRAVLGKLDARSLRDAVRLVNRL